MVVFVQSTASRRGGAVLCLNTMDCSLEKGIAHHILRSHLEFCERVRAKGVMHEQVE